MVCAPGYLEALKGSSHHFCGSLQQEVQFQSNLIPLNENPLLAGATSIQIGKEKVLWSKGLLTLPSIVPETLAGARVRLLALHLCLWLLWIHFNCCHQVL